ncbi:MAG: hypothetical protein SCK29_09955 [Bacillota bacterium]|nr:hypothetical protein [Bacillota bacterium]MDW7684424.1 hypothetical protein [Bacillota bacterium]
MFFFVSESDSNCHRSRSVNRGIRMLLDAKGVQYTEITQLSAYLEKHLGTHLSGPEDIWLLADAHSHAARQLTAVQGKKFAHVHTHADFLHDVLSALDGIFAESHWTKARLVHAYPMLSSRITVCGVPFYPLLADDNPLKHKNLIIFKQSFCHENLAVLEVYLSDFLLSRGCRVIHLSPAQEEPSIHNAAELFYLMREGEKRGMEFVFYSRLEDCYRYLAQAQAMIITPLGQPDIFTILEAGALGTPTLAPDCGTLSELLPPQNLYPPYNLESIIEKACSPPAAQACFEHFSPEFVYTTYQHIMGVS